MASSRQLYHTGSDWDHSVATYVTDYLIFAVGVACLVPSSAMYLRERKKQKGESTTEAKKLLMAFMMYAVLSGISFLFGGVAHNMIDSYGDDVLGLTWDSPNSSWMYAWIVAIALAPPAVFSCVAILFAFAQLPLWAQYVAYAIGASLGIFEIVIVITENNGTAAAYGALLVFLLGGIGVAVLSCRIACQGVRDRTNPFQGRGLLILGMLVTWTGYSVLAFRPEGCTKGHEVSGGCPFSKDFNHNAIFHCFVMMGMIIILGSVVLAVKALHAPCEAAS